MVMGINIEILKISLILFINIILIKFNIFLCVILVNRNNTELIVTISKRQLKSLGNDEKGGSRNLTRTGITKSKKRGKNTALMCV